MRTLPLAAIVVCTVAAAQDAVPTIPAAVAVDVAPLQAVDPDTPYASPRDAARHRLQAALADLQSRRDIASAVRGFGDALVRDPSYALAAFDFGIISAVAGRWDDAIAAFDEVVRLDAKGLGSGLSAQIERLRLIASLDKTPEGKLRRRYDEALYPVLSGMAKLPVTGAMTALADVGKIDPNRWEAPALLAGLSGNGRAYDVSSKFLKIALTNAASDPGVKAALQKALDASERELRYASARSSAEIAADRGEHDKATELFESAWTTVPARAGNGMDAAAEALVLDDTARAASLLLRLQSSPDAQLAESASAMLKHLEAIEPAVKAQPSDAAAFYRDAGSADPVRISSLIPKVDQSGMTILARPLPKLQPDPDPVVLLASLAAEPSEQAQAALPALPDPQVRYETAWRDLLVLQKPQPGAVRPPGPVDSVDASKGARTAQPLAVTTDPAGAKVLLDDEPESVCVTPCSIRLAKGTHAVHLALSGFDEQEATAVIGTTPAELTLKLEPQRGIISVEASAPLTVNGQSVTGTLLALRPGLYTIAAGARQQTVMVKSGAKLRLRL